MQPVEAQHELLLAPWYLRMSTAGALTPSPAAWQDRTSSGSGSLSPAAKLAQQAADEADAEAFQAVEYEEAAAQEVSMGEQAEAMAQLEKWEEQGAWVDAPTLASNLALALGVHPSVYMSTFTPGAD